MASTRIEGPFRVGDAYAFGVSVRFTGMEAVAEAEADGLIISEYKADRERVVGAVGRLFASEPARGKR
jgi:hypothetical protein